MKKYIEQRIGPVKIFENMSWLFLDQILRMGIGLLVGVWVARYLGPEQFGLINYALAFTGLFGAIATLGLPEIIVRDLVSRPQDAVLTLGTGFVLRLLGGVVGFLLVLGVISYLRPNDELVKIIIAIYGLVMIINASEVVAYWFESRVESKFVVWIRTGVFLLIALVKIGMLLLKASLIAFVLATFAEALLVSLLLLTFFHLKVGSLITFLPSVSRAKELLHDSWPLIFTGLAISINMKIDLIMLGHLLGDRAVGIYSSAVRISEIWYFIPGIIVASIFPSLVAAKKKSEELYYNRIQKLYDFMIWMSLSVAILMTFLGDFIIEMLFGIQYMEAGTVLKIHIWAGINVALGTAWSKWMLLENKQNITFYGHLLSAIVNIFANLFLIKSLGVTGAAISTLLSYWISALFGYSLYKPSKSFSLFINSFNIRRLYTSIKKDSNSI